MIDIKAIARQIAEHYLRNERLPEHGLQDFLQALETEDVDFDSVFDLLLPLFEQCSWLEYLYREEPPAEERRAHVRRCQELLAKLRCARRHGVRLVSDLIADVAPEVNRLAAMLYHGIGSCDADDLPEWLRGSVSPDISSEPVSPKSFDVELHAFLHEVLVIVMRRRWLSSKIAAAIGDDLCTLFPQNQTQITELWWRDASLRADNPMARLVAADLAASVGQVELRIEVMHQLLESLDQEELCQIASVLAYLTATLVSHESDLMLYPDPRLPFVVIKKHHRSEEKDCTATLRHESWNERPFLGCLIECIVSSCRYDGPVIAAAMSPLWNEMYQYADDENWVLSVFFEVWSAVPAEWWFWVAYWGDLQGCTDPGIWRSAFQRSLKERKQHLVVLSGMHLLPRSIMYLVAEQPMPWGDTTENTYELVSQTTTAARLCGMQSVVARAFRNLEEFLEPLDDAALGPLLVRLSEQRKELEEHIPEELDTTTHAPAQVARGDIENAAVTLTSVLGRGVWSGLDKWSRHFLTQGLAQISALLKSASPRTDFGGPIRNIIRCVEREFSLRLADRLFDKFGKRIVGLNKCFRYPGKPTYGEISRFLQQVAWTADDEVKDIRQFLLAVSRNGQALIQSGADLEAWTEVWGRAGHGSGDPPDQEDARLFVKAFIDDGLLKRVLSGLRCD